MGFDLSDIYRQTALVFFTAINTLIGLVYAIILFPGSWYKEIYSFVLKQVVHHGDMQSGNITVLFVIFVAVSFLFTHFSNWFEHNRYPAMKINPNNFHYLIFDKFENISTLYEMREKKIILADIVVDSYLQIASKENPSSNRARMLSVRNQQWQFLINYAGTFKLGMYVSIVMSAVRLASYTDLMVLDYLIVALISYLIWLAIELLIVKKIWEMLSMYWGSFEITKINKDTYLYSMRQLMNTKYSKSFWDISPQKRKRIDVKTAKTVIWSPLLIKLVHKIQHKIHYLDRGNKMRWLSDFQKKHPVIFAAGVLFVLLVIIPSGVLVLEHLLTFGWFVEADNGDWLGFWGGYLGSIVAIGGVYYETNKNIGESRREIREQEDKVKWRSLQKVRPFLKTSYDANHMFVEFLTERENAWFKWVDVYFYFEDFSDNPENYDKNKMFHLQLGTQQHKITIPVKGDKRFALKLNTMKNEDVVIFHTPDNPDMLTYTQVKDRFEDSEDNYVGITDNTEANKRIFKSVATLNRREWAKAVTRLDEDYRAGEYNELTEKDITE